MLRATLRRALSRLGLQGVARWTFMRLADGHREISIDGEQARFVHDDFGEYIELNQLTAETEAISRLVDELRPEDTFLDVGSNLGAYAIFAGKTLDEGHVIAVEAVPSTADKLRRNLELNGVGGTAANVAFGDEGGVVSMSVPDSHGSSAVTLDGGDITVKRVRGDDYLERPELPAPTVVKIDVEGYEVSVIEGLHESLRDSACRLVYCEVHPDRLGQFGASPTELEATLEALGFDVTRIAELPGGRYIVRGTKS